MNVLILDGHNLFHRARSGFQLGDYPVVFNFFRALKPLVEKFKPTRVYLTLEGHPKARFALLPEYKANRVVDTSTPEGAAQGDSNHHFFRQVGLIIDTLQHFPISVVQHLDFEADDVVFNLIHNASRAVKFTVVSTDTDFIQLLQQFPDNVRLYNPVTKAYVEAPAYSYLTWKALRGDASDNVPGLPGVGDKTAEALVYDPVGLYQVLSKHGKEFERNVALIRFASWDAEQTKQMTSSSPTKDWGAVKARFAEWAFQSMVKDSYWDKFQATFDTLWGERG